jgi:hypothetical protein
VNLATLKLVAEAALAVCRPLPADLTDDSARTLRQSAVLTLEQLDPFDPRVDAAQFLEVRRQIVNQAIQIHGTFPASRETQNFAAALFCASVTGAPIILTPEAYGFLISILATDDLMLRSCAMQLWPVMLEVLIPRVPRPKGVSVSEVCAENYDDVEFVDRPFPTQARKQPHFLSYEEMTNSATLSQYFADSVDERVAIHRLLFDKMAFDDGMITRFIADLVNEQVHHEETFAKAHILFWSTLCRFFGPVFISILVKRLGELTAPGQLIANHVIAAEIFAGCLHSLKSHRYAIVNEVANILKPFVSNLIATVDPEFHSLWYLSFYASFTDFDPRRLFWLFEHIITCVPKNDSIRAARAVSLIADILLDVAPHTPGLAAKIEELAATSLFSESALEFEQVRECSVRALSSILGLTFDLEKRGKNPESHRVLDRFVTPTRDIFVIRWILGQFGTQSLASLCAGGFVIEHVSEWADFILDKDENEERNARMGLMGVAALNWLGSVCDLPIAVDSVIAFANRMLDQLSPESHPWQVQTCLLLLTEQFLASLFFFLDEGIFEGMIEDRILPGLLHQHPDVQDAASQLLTFVVKSSKQLEEKLGKVVDWFKTMLFDQQSLSRRIAGAKGLGAVISGTLLFDKVPQYVFDSFAALTDAVEVDSTVEQIITDFFSDFWTMHENNLAPNIAEELAPFHASLRPSYFS